MSAIGLTPDQTGDNLPQTAEEAIEQMRFGCPFKGGPVPGEYDVPYFERRMLKAADLLEAALRLQSAIQPSQFPDLPPEGTPLRKLGKRLAELLDEDQWNNLEPLLFDIGKQLAAAPVAQEPVSGEILGYACCNKDGVVVDLRMTRAEVDQWEYHVFPVVALTVSGPVTRVPEELDTAVMKRALQKIVTACDGEWAQRVASAALKGEDYSPRMNNGSQS